MERETERERGREKATEESRQRRLREKEREERRGKQNQKKETTGGKKRLPSFFPLAVLLLKVQKQTHFSVVFIFTPFGKKGGGKKGAKEKVEVSLS